MRAGRPPLSIWQVPQIELLEHMVSKVVSAEKERAGKGILTHGCLDLE